MDPQQPRRVDRTDYTTDASTRARALQALVDGLKLSDLQRTWAFNFENREIADDVMTAILTPYKSGAIDYKEAQLRWVDIYNEHKPPAKASPPPAATPAAPPPTATTTPEPDSSPPAAAQPATAKPASAAPEPPPAEPLESTMPVTPVKPQWNNLEPPADDPDFVLNETSRVERLNDWQAIGASVRGKSHAHKGTFRDDAFDMATCGDWTLTAVSDGAGSSPLSRVAAQIACAKVVKSLQGTLANYTLSAPPGDMEKLNSDLTRLRSFLVEAGRVAQEAVLREVNQRGLQVRDMYATLLVMVHTAWGKHEIVAALQVGDGAIGVLFEKDSGEQECTVLGDADHGEYSSETRFLTTPGIDREFSSRVKFTVKSRIQCIAVMSDGVSDDFFPEEKRLIQLFCGDPISVEGMLSSSGEPVPGVLTDLLVPGKHSAANLGADLVAWLQYEKRGSFDDRTLVLLHRSPA
ncbi:PP2C family serine/threonine-protein phosphatase [Lignipirellula cremea]|uniref:PPM-type phosphatase domain-containing protein n=1 Tax=Lignipirellula cremea TaxID=2528010 RepID=A0A518DPU2_9BACT|nr:PP2C family serine/threonine-protein phosphatase [Lignipirellula cremea]QDU93854.1 hypothetical protein Pla8534_16380 [Lignipirellula cremea]